ncbi:pilus assembly protein TadG-related protein [Fictibacillus sp. UD]|uniref:pilus assembly protein TadG-related protein n=1 Tax=Fictibacillus sp. UD TaxID=3038777 RepID=UPI003746EF92
MKIKHVDNEKGSTLLVVMGLLIASIFISFIFFDFFTTFATKRVSQTSADAAALAASNEAKKVYDEELSKELKDRMEKLKKDADKEKDKEGKEEGEEPPVEDDGLLGGIFDGVGKEMPPDLEEWLEDPSVDVDLNDALKYLFEEDEVNDIACGAINENRNRIEEAARYYATKNKSDDVEVEFFYNNAFQIYVEVKKGAEFVTVDEEALGDNNQVKANASAVIQAPKGMNIVCN